MNNNQIYQLYKILQQIYNSQIVFNAETALKLLENLRILDPIASEIEKKRQEIISKYLREGEVQVPMDLVPQVNEELAQYGSEAASPHVLNYITFKEIKHLTLSLVDLEILLLIITQDKD